MDLVRTQVEMPASIAVFRYCNFAQGLISMLFITSITLAVFIRSAAPSVANILILFAAVPLLLLAESALDISKHKQIDITMIILLAVHWRE